MAVSGSNALDSSEAAMEVPKTLLKLKTENENILILLGKLKIYIHDQHQINYGFYACMNRAWWENNK